MITGNDANSKDVWQQRRNYSFKTAILDFAGIFEYHFFNFRGNREPYKFSPYLFGGLGFNNATVWRNKMDSGKYQPGPKLIVPFGIGVKKELTPVLNLGIEWRTHKVFSDEMDGIYDGDPNTAPWVTRPPVDMHTKKDLYHYLGISLSYRFVSVRCPESSADYIGE
jgi:hypothetical protein